MNATPESGSPQKSGVRLWGILAIVAAAGFLYLVAANLMRPVESGTEGPAIGHTLPYFQIEALTGDSKPVSRDDLKGRVTVVNYWGTWCPPCRLELPHIVDLAERFRSHPDFRLYAVSCSSGRDEDLEPLRAETQAFLEAGQVAMPTYADQNFASRQAVTMVLNGEQFAYPTTLVLDRGGVIRGLWIGYRSGTERAIAGLVEELLQADSPKAEQPAEAS
jgi:thiol-disulfide isomerase/thioredoxin